MAGHTVVIEPLIDAGAALEARAERGDTALGAAAAAAHVDTVLALLEAGADANAPSRDDLPPLHQAVMGGATGAVAALLAREADPNLVDARKGNTALMLAANRGYLDIMRLLLGRGARVDLRAKDGWTAFQAAEMIGDDEAMALLRRAGAQP